MIRTLLSLLFLLLAGQAKAAPWSHGPLKVSENHRFLMHADGTPFFLLGETAWLLPQKLDRDEVKFYLDAVQEAGYNMVQMQVLNALPSINVYGQLSYIPPQGNDVDPAAPATYTYWDHVDYIIDEAARRDIYVGMVCVWGSQVKSGAMTEPLARDYGRFLALRYGPRPNIIWLMGGDIEGHIHPEVWQTMATTIKAIDQQHLMTYHPRGRTTSARWWSDAPWIDFHCFQSGHRRYGQRTAKDRVYPIPDNTEEDSWQYVDSTWTHDPLRPVIDDEPVYEDIPQGLHDPAQPRWQACDVRRYAYWSVFAGSCGHSYGHNSIMQFLKPGQQAAYGAAKPWYVALRDPGFRQMCHLKRLMLALPYFERVPDQSVVLDNGSRYDRLAATRGNDYLLVYNYTARPMRLDLTRISGQTKRLWWMDAATGRLTYLGECPSRVQTFRPRDAADGVLIAIDADRDYLSPEQPGLD